MILIPVLDCIINKSLPKSRILNLSERNVEDLYDSILLLSSKFIKNKDFNKKLDYFLEKEEILKIRKSIFKEPTLLLGIKGAAFSILKNKIDFKEKDRINELYDEFLEKPFTFKKYERYANINSIRKAIDLYKPFSNEIKEYPKILKPNEIKKQCASYLSKLEPKIKSFTYRKLRFICNSNYLEIEDLVSKLKEELISCLYFEIYSNNEEKLNKILTNKIHQLGINLIYYYTAGKRSELTELKDSQGNFIRYQALTQSNIVTNNGDEGDILDYYQAEELSDINNINIRNNIDFNYSFYKRINKSMEDLKIEKSKNEINSYKFKDKNILKAKEEFLNILSNNSDNFISWYNQRKERRVEANKVSDIAEYEGRKILILIKEFLGLETPIFLFIVNKYKEEFKELF